MIPQIEPWIDNEELKEIEEVIRSTWITEGKKTKEFEENFIKLTGARYAHAFCNGTATLFSALKILGIGPGDEIIAPSATFIATINSIILAGAKPVLVDIEKETFNINPDEIEKKITKNTKAIMPVHLYGQSSDMEKIMKIAKKHGLYVIEDAAQAVGVKFNGKHVGTFGEIGSFSFYGNKTITTGEGGMLITNDKILSDRGYRFKNHGRLEKGTFIHEEVGLNFSFTEMQAAIGLAQLRKLNEIIRRKEKIRQRYMEELKNLKTIKFTPVAKGVTPVHWFTNILVENIEKVQEELKTKGVQTRRFFYPIARQPCYKEFDFSKEKFPNADFAYAHCLSLPSSATLEEKDLKIVCDSLKSILK